MLPIVDRLSEEYEGGVSVRKINVSTERGAEEFQGRGLPGHPSVVILDRQGRETYRGFGVIAIEVLRQELDEISRVG
jgi:thiol-disulfide isomerase/thioredoxin